MRHRNGEVFRESYPGPCEIIAAAHDSACVDQLRHADFNSGYLQLSASAPALTTSSHSGECLTRPGDPVANSGWEAANDGETRGSIMTQSSLIRVRSYAPMTRRQLTQGLGALGAFAAFGAAGMRPGQAAANVTFFGWQGYDAGLSASTIS